MATKKEWLDYFELMNDKQATSEELAAAYANGEIELSSEEISLSEGAVASESLTTALSESESLSDSAFSSEAPHIHSQEEWLEYFVATNGRKPSLDEFQAAKKNGEFASEAPAASNTAQPVSQAPTQAPVSVQSNQGQQTNSERDEFGRVIQPDVVNAQPTATGKVGFFAAFKLFFKNYVNFTGRSSRAEYWYMVLWIAIISIIPMIIVMIAAVSAALAPYDASSRLGSLGAAIIFLVLLFLFYLAIIVPGLALGIRRFRDAGISQVGYIGFIIIAVALGILELIPILGFLAGLAAFALSIYEIVIFARPSDYYRTHREPITDWLTAHFGKK